MAVLFSGVSSMIKPVLVVVALGWLWFSWRHRQPVRVIRLRGAVAEIGSESCRVWVHQGRLAHMKTRWWISLEVYPAHRRRWYRRRWLTVFADQLSAADFHRLGVWLRHHPRGSHSRGR